MARCGEWVVRDVGVQLRKGDVAQDGEFLVCGRRIGKQALDLRQALALAPAEPLAVERMGELWLAVEAAEERIEGLRKALVAELKRRGSLPLPGGGTLRWAEQQTVTIDKGHFSVLLGEAFAAEARRRFGDC